MSSLWPGLPPVFAFSQQTLQLFCDCPRRFWLAVVRRLPWPAVEAVPAADLERRLRRGEHFHRMVERAQRGLAAAPEPEADPELRAWFEAWQTYAQRGLPPLREIERTLGASLALGNGTSVRLLARLDLIAVEPQRRAVIVDWKTGHAPADPTALRERVQSILYPWLLVRASAALPWGPLSSEAIEMRYWFASTPRNPIVLRYNSERHAAHEERLRALLTDILSRRTEEEFPPAPDCAATRTRLCSYCIYRSRCTHDQKPGPVSCMDGVRPSIAPTAIPLFQPI